MNFREYVPFLSSLPTKPLLFWHSLPQGTPFSSTTHRASLNETFQLSQKPCDVCQSIMEPSFQRNMQVRSPIFRYSIWPWGIKFKLAARKFYDWRERINSKNCKIFDMQFYMKGAFGQSPNRTSQAIFSNWHGWTWFGQQSYIRFHWIVVNVTWTTSSVFVQW